MTGTANVTVDTSEAERELAQLRETANITASTTAATVRKSYQSLALLAQVFAIAIPMWFDLMATAAIMAGETFAELAAAETASVWLAAKASVTFSIALLMFYRAMAIKGQKTEVENRLNSVLQLGNMWF